MKSEKSSVSWEWVGRINKKRRKEAKKKGSGGFMRVWYSFRLLVEEMFAGI